MPILELTIQRKTEDGYPIVASLTRSKEFLPVRREGMLELDRTVLTSLQLDPLLYGTTLGKALFNEEIRDTFRDGLTGEDPLRVLLSIEDSDLRTIDWHRLAGPFDSRWRFLAVQQKTPFSLSTPSPASSHFPAIGRRNLSALLLVAGPELLSRDYQLDSFDVPSTIKSVLTSLGEIPCDILSEPSLDTLCAAITDKPYTLLHIVCHGAVTKKGETILYFPKDERGTPTSASDFLDRLASLSRLPHFVFLSTCESALPQNGLGSLARRLIRDLGLPAVLAMTEKVSIDTAQAIAMPFYTKLYEHGQPDLALAQSLAGLQGKFDLTVPALLSRLGDRPLFDDNTERDLTDQELEFGLARLAELLPERAPVLNSLRDSLTRNLRATLEAKISSLSDARRTERAGTLSRLNSLSLEALDLSFNALCLGQAPPLYDSRSPFRGLESFRPEDAPYFFGRDGLTKKLVQKLNNHNFLAVLGASGSGKSSLVMAGLIPALSITYAIFRPGTNPLLELDRALETDPNLLLVDQFEEFFTISKQEQHPEFISRLLEEIHHRKVVLTLRADFLGEVASIKTLKDEVEAHQLIIPPMDAAELRRAMEEQATCAGLRFESDLSQQMLDDVKGEPGAMPLLQHALWTLWTRRHGRWLRADEYRAFGRVKQAIASTAETVYAGCSEFERERLRDIFLRLTRLDEDTDGRNTRRRVLMNELIPADSDPTSTKLLIKQLADARLVVISDGEVEVAHEALIRYWERLHAWLADDRENVKLRESLSDAAKEWDEKGRDESLLIHRGGRLEDAEILQNQPHYPLNTLELEYLSACTSLRDRELLERQKRQAELERLLRISEHNVRQAVAGQLAMAAKNFKTAYPQRSLLLALESIYINRQVGEPVLPVAEEALREAMEEVTGIGVPAQPGQATVEFSLDPEFLRVKGYNSQDRLWKISSLLSGEEIKPGKVDFNPVEQKIFQASGTYSEPDIISSQDGRFRAKAGKFETTHIFGFIEQEKDASIELEDTHLEKTIKLTGMEDAVRSLAFSPDTNWLAAGSFDGGVRIWDLHTYPSENRFTHPGTPYPISVSRSGKWLVAGNELRQLEDGRLIGLPILLSTEQAPVTLAVFSPKERWLLIAIYLWEQAEPPQWPARFLLYDLCQFESQSVPQPVELSRWGNTNIHTILFSPDDQWLVLSGGNGPLQIWDLANPGPEACFTAQEIPIADVEFSETSNLLIALIESSYQERRIVGVRVWKLSPGNPPVILEIESFRNLPVNDIPLKVSPGGRWLLTTQSLAGIRQSFLTNMERFESGGSLIPYSLGAGLTFANFSQDQNFLTYRVANPTDEKRQNLFVVDLSHTQANRPIFPLHVKWEKNISPMLSPSGKWLVAHESQGNSCADWVGLLSDLNGSSSFIQISARGKGITNFSGGGGGGGGPGEYNVDYRANLGLVKNLLEDHQDSFLELRGHEEPIDCVIISPDERFVVTIDHSLRLRLWDIDLLEQNPNRDPVLLPELCAEIVQVGFSPDSSLFIVSTKDNCLRVWDTDINRLVSRAEICAGRNFISNEWNRFFPGKDYRKTVQRLPEHPSVLRFDNLE